MRWALLGILVLGFAFGAWFWHGLLKRDRRARVSATGVVSTGGIMKLASFPRPGEEDFCQVTTSYEVDGQRYLHVCEVPEPTYTQLRPGEEMALHYDPADPFASVCTAEGRKAPKPMHFLDMAAASACPVLSLAFIGAAALRMRRR